MSDVLDRALTLVYPDADHSKLVLDQQGLRVLRGLDDLPIVVLGVAGPMRTGKSLLMNVLNTPSQSLVDLRQSFPTGETSNPCTKGVLIWGNPKRVHLPKYGDCFLILMDTEGLCSFEASRRYDNALISVTLLLSSYFIFNTLGTITSDLFNQLGFVVQFARRVSGQHSQIQDDDPTTKPNFMLLLRDFVLSIRNQEKPDILISAHEWWHDCLNNNGDLYDSVRTAIRNAFRESTCATLPMPAKRSQDVREIGSHPEWIIPEFREEILQIRNSIFQQLHPKAIFDRDSQNVTLLTGKKLAGLLESLVTTINNENSSGSWLPLSGMWSILVGKSLEEASTCAIRRYNESMIQYLKQGGPHIDTDTQFLALHESAVRSAKLVFDSKATSYANQVQVQREWQSTKSKLGTVHPGTNESQCVCTGRSLQFYRDNCEKSRQECHNLAERVIEGVLSGFLTHMHKFTDEDLLKWGPNARTTFNQLCEEGIQLYNRQARGLCRESELCYLEQELRSVLSPLLPSLEFIARISASHEEEMKEWSSLLSTTLAAKMNLENEIVEEEAMWRARVDAQQQILIEAQDNSNNVLAMSLQQAAQGEAQIRSAHEKQLKLFQDQSAHLIQQTKSQYEAILETQRQCIPVLERNLAQSREAQRRIH